MTELDKKIQKTQTDLVQSVLEAMEKKNVERCDMLITNAFKQLKMSRFKPDQTVCISLTYLARVCPQCFSQSNNLKELLKTFIKRDNGPTTIKNTKNDYVLPVLAANTLLACCDSTELRTVILNRIEQWINSNQRLNEPIVQHLLATLCVRCQGDPVTIKTLIENRNHWFQFLENNFDTYGLASKDLSKAIRELLSSETNCESVVEILSFLKRHDSDITGLTTAISEFVIRRPITFDIWLEDPDLGDQLKQTVMSLYNRLFELLTSTPARLELRAPVFIEFTSSDDLVTLEEVTLEAILSLVASDKLTSHLEHAGLVVGWLNQLRTKTVIGYKNVTRTIPYDISSDLMIKLIHTNDLMVDLVLKCATPPQLIDLAHQFGLKRPTLEKVLKKIEDVEAEILIKLGFHSSPYFNELMQLYCEMGLESAIRLSKLEASMELDCKNIKPEALATRIKTEPM